MKHLCLLLPFALPTAAYAEAPNIQTPSPVLYLADNLDEPDQLGYCLDTVGRGQSDRAHVHSCKPRGGDVQFQFNPTTQQIQSVAFSGICLDIVDKNFALLECSDAQTQKFTFGEVTGEIRLLSNPSQCLSSAAYSRQAGPYLSRDIAITECEATPVELKSWIQR